MKKYADTRENFIRHKNQKLCDVIKDKFLKSLAYEKALKEKVL